MAVGFPTKVSYANGDVFSASDINDTNGTINLLTSTTLSRAAGKNPVINGGMDVWQRGTSFSLPASTTAANGFSADRWQTKTDTNQAVTLSRQATSDTTNLPNIQYALRYQRNSGQTGTTGIFLAQSIESVNSIPFAGQTITLSFYARRGANYSASSNLLTTVVYTGTGTDQNILTGYTGSASPITSNATLTTTWQRFSYTATVSSSATEMAVAFYWVPVGTAGAADYFEVTGVQVELGSVATTFSRAGSTYNQELSLCQRYFYQISGTDNPVFNCNTYTTTSIYGVFHLKQTMRIAPTLTSSAASALKVLAASVEKATTAISISVSNPDQVEFSLTTAAFASAGYGGWTRFNGASQYLQFSSEL
jgi:hypothetical protein